MTAQIPNSFILQDKPLYILSTQESLFIHPMQFGIETEYRSTACVDGYYCNFGLKDDALVLKELYVSTPDDPPKPIGNVYPQECNNFVTSYVYKDLDLPIEDYTGKILLGDDFLDDYYVHMGYQSFWAFGELWELTFEKGQLCRVHSRSAVGKAVRQYLQKTNQSFLRSRDTALLETLGVASWW